MAAARDLLRRTTWVHHCEQLEACSLDLLPGCHVSPDAEHARRLRGWHGSPEICGRHCLVQTAAVLAHLSDRIRPGRGRLEGGRSGR